MNKPDEQLRLVFCGPGDVAEELAAAKRVVEEWNGCHADAYQRVVQLQHWKTNTHPELGNRPQAVVNHQLIDQADLVVAVFRSRFGSPTGVAASGTEEELKRAVAQNKLVMVYFHTPGAADAPDTARDERVTALQQELQSQGLYASFASTAQFEADFRRHLAAAVQRLASAAHYDQTAPPPAPAQNIVGNHNVQVGGDVRIYTKPPVEKNVIERRLDGLSPAHAQEVKELIDALVAETTGQSRSEAYASWWGRLQRKFRVNAYENLRPEQLPEVRQWQRSRLGILRGSAGPRDPESRRRHLITVCKSAMNTLGKTTEQYYPEVAARLTLKPFASLKDLTDYDLKRVATMMRRDSQGG